MSDGGRGRSWPDFARAWLELARISNLPTVLSNAIAGATIGSCAYAIEHAPVRGIVHWFGGFESHPGPDGPVDPVATPLGAVRFLGPLAIPMAAYVGGMILNDAFDAEIDARERPTRPIPSGRVGRRAAFAAGFTLLGVSIALAFAASAGAAVVIATALLAVAIVVYDRFHSKSIASTLLLALCRALAALIPMLAFAEGEFVTLVTRGAIALPIALAAWTLGLSLLAREEVALRIKLEARTTDEPAPLPCPGCGHLVAGGFTNCPECGRPSSAHERAVLASHTRSSASWLLAIAPVLAAIGLLALFFATHAALLHREDPPRSDLAAGASGIAIILAIVLVWRVMVARTSVRKDPARMPEFIGVLIACLALVDAMALATGGHWLAALVCLALFGLTRRAQRSIAGS